MLMTELGLEKPKSGKEKCFDSEKVNVGKDSKAWTLEAARTGFKFPPASCYTSDFNLSDL